MLDIKAAVRACQLRFVLLEVEEPCAEALCVVSLLGPRCKYNSSSSSYRVAVCMPACYRVWLVQHAVAYLAREVRAQAVKVGLQRLELLCSVSGHVPQRCVCVCVCVGVCVCVSMRAYLVCPAWAWWLVALVCRLLLEAVAARRPRWPVCTCLFDQPGDWPAGSRGAAARRSRCRSHAVCLGGRGGRGAWWCAAVHGGRSSARSSVERKDKLPA
jgi:hypothetical protein